MCSEGDCIYSEFTVFPSSFTIDADMSSDVKVNFTPRTGMSVMDTLTVISNDTIRPEVSLTLMANFGLADSPWPMEGHDLQHTGQSPYNSILVPNLRWKFKAGSGINSFFTPILIFH